MPRKRLEPTESIQKTAGKTRKPRKTESTGEDDELLHVNKKLRVAAKKMLLSGHQNYHRVIHDTENAVVLQVDDPKQYADFILWFDAFLSMGLVNEMSDSAFVWSSWCNRLNNGIFGTGNFTENIQKQEVRLSSKEILQKMLDDIGSNETVGSDLICRKCKSKDISANSTQSRSIDEGMTTECMCRSCGHRWKM
jgi:DNA-directed RNA polymerase subunit M/transcription elongation factor TFIIS